MVLIKRIGPPKNKATNAAIMNTIQDFGLSRGINGLFSAFDMAPNW